MRQYGIIFGILFLSLIDFALAAPIPAQEGLRACVDVPRDTITVMEKRGNDDLVEKLTAYFEKWADPPASSSSLLSGPEHESSSDTQTSSSPPMVPEHESSSDTQASSSTPLGPEHGSTNDAQTSSSQPPGSEHGPIKVEQAPAPTPEPGPSTANPNPLVEPPNPLSTGPSTYTQASTRPSSYASTEYGSDDESAGTHASQLSYPSDWDIWLNPQDHPDQEHHTHQPDSPPSPQQQNGFALESDVQQQQPQPDWHQNGFAHGDDVQHPPLLNWHQNGFAHGDDIHQPSRQNGFAHDQTDDAASTGSSTHDDTTSTGSVSTSVQDLADALLAAYNELLDTNEAHQGFHVYHPAQPSSPPQEFVHGTQMDNVQQSPPSQQNAFAHGVQMDGVVPTDPASHTSTSVVYGLDHGSLGTHGSQPGLTPTEGDNWQNPDDSPYYDIYPQSRPSPPP